MVYPAEFEPLPHLRVQSNTPKRDYSIHETRTIHHTNTITSHQRKHSNYTNTLEQNEKQPNTHHPLYLQTTTPRPYLHHKPPKNHRNSTTRTQHSTPYSSRRSQHRPFKTTDVTTLQSDRDWPLHHHHHTDTIRKQTRRDTI